MLEAFTYFCGALFILITTCIRIMAHQGRFNDRIDEDEDI